MTQLIGPTPLLQLNHILQASGCVARIAVKLEGMYPSASVKDRIDMSMIEKAEVAVLIQPRKTILVEPISGNTGIALAMVATAKGYRLILTTPDPISQERRAMLKAYGTDLEMTPGENGMRGRSRVRRKLLLRLPMLLCCNSFVIQLIPKFTQKRQQKKFGLIPTVKLIF